EVTIHEEPHPVLTHTKLKWLPVLAANYKNRLLNQIEDYRKGYKLLKQTLIADKIDLLIAHGAPAGAIADKATRGLGIPYVVSLFEPHADYMLESGVWRQHGLKYRMQKHWENLQKKNAAGLMPVTEAYRQKLLAEGVSADKIMVVPCSVAT